MSITPIQNSTAHALLNPVELNSATVQSSPASQGVATVGESVSSMAETGESIASFFQPVLDFFSSIGESIHSFFLSTLELFLDCFGGGDSKTKKTSKIIFSQDVPPSVYEGFTVNQDKLREAPEQIDPANIEHLARNATPPIVIGELLVQFDRICDSFGVGVDDVLYQDEGREITRRNARISLRDNYIGFVQEHLNNHGSGNYDQMVAQEIDIALKGIIFGLRAPQDGSTETEEILAKKRTSIEKLCSAAEHCRPRRHTEAFQVYRVLSNQMETTEQIILQYIQETKENLFLNFYSLSTQPGHTLNYIRREVGEQLGLNRSRVNLEDPYIDMGGRSALSPDNPRSPHQVANQFLEVFNRIYNPSNVLFNMKNFLNQRIASDEAFMSEISQFIQSEILIHQQAGRLTEYDNEDLPMPYQNDLDHPDAAFHLTDLGVRFLLVHFGHLNSTVPNGHLVRRPAQVARPAAGAA